MTSACLKQAKPALPLSACHQEGCAEGSAHASRDWIMGRDPLSTRAAAGGSSFGWPGNLLTVSPVRRALGRLRKRQMRQSRLSG